MKQYIGKQLLIDCYRCNFENLMQQDQIIATLTKAADDINMEIIKNFILQTDTDLLAIVYGNQSYISLRIYPFLNYASIDIYLFNKDLLPSKAMKIFRAALSPEQIRATTVKRGNFNLPLDMKPKTNTKSTTMHKIKNTGRKINKAGKKVVNIINIKKSRK